MSGRRTAWVLVGVLAAVSQGCASAGGPRGGIGEVHRIKEIERPPESRFVARSEGVRVGQAGGVTIGARKEMALDSGARIQMATRRRARLLLGSEFNHDWGWVVVTPELTTALGTSVFGPQSGTGEFLIREDRQVDIFHGAVVLKDWGTHTGDPICVWAADVCARTSGGSYTLRVVGDRARLFVESGVVEIDRPGGAGPVSCERVENLVGACRVADGVIEARAETAWEWSAGGAIEPLTLDDEAQARLRDAIQYNGEDIWRERGSSWYPLLLIPVAAAIVCVATDVWVCGGNGPDDVGARVRFVP